MTRPDSIYNNTTDNPLEVYFEVYMKSVLPSGPSSNSSFARRKDPLERLLMIFLDGVGVGRHDLEINPFAHAKLGFFPQFVSDAGGAIDIRFPNHSHPLAEAGHHTIIDACLEVPGTPQSATGQASLFTGINCARVLGRHLTAFPNEPLAEIVRSHNLLYLATRAGLEVAFLNTYTPRFRELGWPHSVSTICALSTGRDLFDLNASREGRSLYHDITQADLRARYGPDIPLYTPNEAGRRLSAAALAWDVALFEHFLTDRVGHKARRAPAVQQVHLVEAFLAGVLDGADLSSTLVVISSDHGNLEDLGTRGHTRNPVPFAAWGPRAAEVVGAVESLEDVTPALLALLLA